MKCLPDNENRRTRKNKICTCDICFQACNNQDEQVIESEFQACGKAWDCHRTHKNGQQPGY